MAATDIEPLEDAYKKMREATRPNPPIPDRRGPKVYEVTQDPSLNGVNPAQANTDGYDVHHS